jgi:uncharacterized protein YggE
MIFRSNILLLLVYILICISCSSQDGISKQVNTQSNLAINEDIYTKSSLNLSSSSQNGVWITGKGKISAKPDISIVSLGVEVRRKTLSEARADSAESMSGIIKYLLTDGIIEDDIRTANLSMTPEYVWRKVNSNCLKNCDQERIINGYVVNNTLSIILRDLSRIGKIVDGSLAVGGKDTMINGIKFSIEDVEILETKARELAVKKVMDKARQLEALTEMKLGPIIYITENGSEPVIGAPTFKSSQIMSEMAFDTPIISGSLDVETSIRIGFAIK